MHAPVALSYAAPGIVISSLLAPAPPMEPCPAPDAPTPVRDEPPPKPASGGQPRPVQIAGGQSVCGEEKPRSYIQQRLCSYGAPLARSPAAESMPEPSIVMTSVHTRTVAPWTMPDRCTSRLPADVTTTRVHLTARLESVKQLGSMAPVTRAGHHAVEAGNALAEIHRLKPVLNAGALHGTF